MYRKILWLLITLLPLGLILVGIGSAGVFAQKKPSSVAIRGKVNTSATATRGHWTKERQKHAIPAHRALDRKTHGPSTPSAIGLAASKPPTGPTHSPSSIQLQADTVSYPYPYPQSAVGKVFFTDPVTGSDYVCSGTAVTSNNLNTVDTAGHCVASGGEQRFYTNWAFCPQYYSTCPDGDLWTASVLWTHTNWYDNGWFAYDYGEAVVSPNDSGNLVDSIGGVGWAYNQPYSQDYVALGFPAAAPFDGSQMWSCSSGFYDYDSPSSGPTTLGITCDMTGGSSGGGWLISIDNTFGYVNGHNDYKYTNDSAHMYSPYYGDDWFAVFDAAQNS